MSWISKLLSKLFSIREQSDGDIVKPFLDHLEDLRVMLMKMLLTLGCGTALAFTVRKQIMALLLKPLQSEHNDLHLVEFDLTSPFMISLKLSFYAGIVISFPFLLWFLAGFVLPALTRKEKRLLVPGIFGGFVLFSLGVVAAYEFILPKTIRFFSEYANDVGIAMTLQATKYYSFVCNLAIACGLLCELPVVILALSALGIVSYQLLASTRAYAVTVILILVALIAPSPDPFTFIVMGAPVIGIYELCIWIVWFMERRRKEVEKKSGQS